MFRTLIYPSSGACDYSVALPNWYPCYRLKLQPTTRIPLQPNHTETPSTHRTRNNTTNVAIQQNSRKLLMMDILMSETYWAHKKLTKIASDIKLVFYSSTITMMHGPINISFQTFPLGTTEFQVLGRQTLMDTANLSMEFCGKTFKKIKWATI